MVIIAAISKRLSSTSTTITASDTDDLPPLIAVQKQTCQLDFKDKTIKVNVHQLELDSITLLRNIYNGIIFPSLNPAKIFQFISR